MCWWSWTTDDRTMGWGEGEPAGWGRECANVSNNRFYWAFFWASTVLDACLQAVYETDRTPACCRGQTGNVKLPTQSLLSPRSLGYYGTIKPTLGDFKGPLPATRNWHLSWNLRYEWQVFRLRTDMAQELPRRWKQRRKQGCQTRQRREVASVYKGGRQTARWTGPMHAEAMWCDAQASDFIFCRRWRIRQ